MKKKSHNGKDFLVGYFESKDLRFTYTIKVDFFMILPYFL